MVPVLERTTMPTAMTLRPMPMPSQIVYLESLPSSVLPAVLALGWAGPPRVPVPVPDGARASGAADARSSRSTALTKSALLIPAPGWLVHQGKIKAKETVISQFCATASSTSNVCIKKNWALPQALAFCKESVFFAFFFYARVNLHGATHLNRPGPGPAAWRPRPCCTGCLCLNNMTQCPPP